MSMSAQRLASRPRIGSATLPVSRPSSLSRVLARSSSAPIRAAIAEVNWRKPPDTMTTFAPRARMVRASVSAPGLSVIRASSTSSITSSGRPSSSLTRSRNAGSKSISPRIARSVMAATWGPRPTSAASSSTHSWPIKVESMSAMTSLFSRPSSGWTMTSTGSPAKCAASAARLASRSPVTIEVRRRALVEPGAALDPAEG